MNNSKSSKSRTGSSSLWSKTSHLISEIPSNQPNWKPVIGTQCLHSPDGPKEPATPHKVSLTMQSPLASDHPQKNSLVTGPGRPHHTTAVQSRLKTSTDSNVIPVLRPLGGASTIVVSVFRSLWGWQGNRQLPTLRALNAATLKMHKLLPSLFLSLPLMSKATSPASLVLQAMPTVTGPPEPQSQPHGCKEETRQPNSAPQRNDGEFSLFGGRLKAVLLTSQLGTVLRPQSFEYLNLAI